MRRRRSRESSRPRVTNIFSTSWPGLPRPSTSCCAEKTWMARTKAGRTNVKSGPGGPAKCSACKGEAGRLGQLLQGALQKLEPVLSPEDLARRQHEARRPED